VGVGQAAAYTGVLGAYPWAPQFRSMTKERRHKRPLHVGLAFDQV
jgi:hypothetical protein